MLFFHPSLPLPLSVSHSHTLSPSLSLSLSPANAKRSPSDTGMRRVSNGKQKPAVDTVMSVENEDDDDDDDDDDDEEEEDDVENYNEDSQVRLTDKNYLVK